MGGSRLEGGTTAPASHAVAAAQLLFVPGQPVPASGRFALYGSGVERATRVLGLPAGDAIAVPSVAFDRDSAWRPVELPARGLAVLPSVRRLAALPPGPDWPAWSRPSASVLAWSVAAKYALELVAAGRLLPTLAAASAPATGRAWWRAVPTPDGRLEALAAAFPPAAHLLRRGDGTSDAEVAVWPADELVARFLDAVADSCARAGRRPRIDARRRTPRAPLAEMWSAALAGSEPTLAGLALRPDELALAVEDWASPVLARATHAAARLAIAIHAPDGPAPDDGPDERPWRLTYHLQSSAEPDVALPVAAVWQHDGPVMLGERRLEDAEATVVTGLATAARLFAPVRRSLSQIRPAGLDLTVAEASDFLADGASALASAGIGVVVPPQLRSAAAYRVRLRLVIGHDTPVPERVRADHGLALPALADARYTLAVGDETVTAADVAALAALDQPLVRWRDRWVRLDRTELDAVAALDGKRVTLDLAEALAAALSGRHATRDHGIVDTIPSGAMAALVERLRQADRPGAADIVGIRGTLRAYQERGLAWLQRLTGMGMGAVLADAMGMGKTLQAIALMTSRVGRRPHLVVCPTSVMGNWEREIARFAPGLRVIRHHGRDRPDRRSAFRPGHVAVTSYALLRRDLPLLERVPWDVVVLDEAQQVKNPGSKGARAARALDARATVALTGTPVENRLADLWAIVDATNPGLLGSQRAFTARYAAPIERWHDADAAARLKRLIAPFVLRRVKDDPEVAVDLPDKQEITVACPLTREQAALYERAVEDAFAGGLGLNPFERRGRILTLITRLKQVCNHPVHYLGDNGPLEDRSGKLTRATEVLGEIVDSGDHALVFTQFREMGDLLVRHLGSVLELPEVPFLHGGVPAAARDAMVARFQEDADAPPVFVVSLRAGGTGLNLTRATEVVHYDRWWNPAVEDQATDRAHRIGQARPVTVHRLVTAGTLEERIDALLARKRDLADAVVGVGEGWIGDLDDAELRELVALSVADIDDDGPDDDLPPPEVAAAPAGRRGLRPVTDGGAAGTEPGA